MILQCFHYISLSYKNVKVLEWTMIEVLLAKKTIFAVLEFSSGILAKM